MALSRVERILQDTLSGVTTDIEPLSRNEVLLLQIQKLIIEGGGGGGGGISFVRVDELPSENISPTTVYLIPSSTGEGNDIDVEFVYVDGKWEQLGMHQDGTGIDYSKLTGLPEDIPAGYVDSLFDDV